jgi:hypothetical protein
LQTRNAFNAQHKDENLSARQAQPVVEGVSPTRRVLPAGYHRLVEAAELLHKLIPIESA